jgi:hypothetical protein
MITGQRVKPVPTRDNLYGYVKKMYAPPIVSNADDDDSCCLLSTKSYPFVSKATSGVILEADDIGRWDHDYIRLMCLIPSIFGKEYHFYAASNMRDGKSIESYHEICSQLFGTKTRDIEIARATINNFKLRRDRPIRSEIERWEELFLNLEGAEDRPMSERDKRAFIVSKLV